MTIKTIIGPTILTASGKYFDLAAPDPAAIDIDDIATALSKICRFSLREAGE